MPSVPAAAAAPSGQVKLVRAVLILSCLVAAFAGLVTGYLLGLRGYGPAIGGPPPPSAPASKSEPAPVETPQDPTPEPPAPEPPAAPPAPPEKTPATEQSATPPPAEAPPTEEPPVKVIPAPEAALMAFLAAPDWKSRALHVLHPEETTPKMEAYHATAPDGPTAYLSLHAKASEGDGEKDARLLGYLVVTESHPEGLPIAVVETPAGWKIDWDTFIEFRDDHFGRFAAGQGGDTGAFHVLVRNTHYFGEPFPGSEQLTAFRLDPPLPDRNQYAFVATGSELHKTLAGVTEWGRPFAPVLQLVRKPHGERQFHLEIESIVAPNWRPRE